MYVTLPPTFGASALRKHRRTPPRLKLSEAELLAGLDEAEREIEAAIAAGDRETLINLDFEIRDGGPYETAPGVVSPTAEARAAELLQRIADALAALRKHRRAARRMKAGDPVQDLTSQAQALGYTGPPGMMPS